MHDFYEHHHAVSSEQEESNEPNESYAFNTNTKTITFIVSVFSAYNWMNTTTHHSIVQKRHKNNHYICPINIIIRDRLIPLSTMHATYSNTSKSIHLYNKERDILKMGIVNILHDPGYTDAIIEFECRVAKERERESVLNFRHSRFSLVLFFFW